MSLETQLSSNNERMTGLYMWSVITLGAAAMTIAVWKLPYSTLDFKFFLLALCTVAIGPYLTIRIPRFNTHVAVSDVFIFLGLLLYGPAAAILIAGVEAFVSARRFCNRYFTVFFNAAALAFSLLIVGTVLELGGLNSPEQLRGAPPFIKDFIFALTAMALVQFLVNTSIANAYDSIRGGQNFIESWKNNYIWTFLSYFIGAVGAGSLVQLVQIAGFGVILAAFPITLFLFLTYRMYLRNVEMSVEQAQQAELYARDLEKHANALRESEERFRSAFNYAPIGIALISSNGQWLKVNHALCRILGYTEDELTALVFRDVIAREDLGEALVKFNEILSGRITSCQLEQRFIHRSGRIVWAAWSLSTSSNVRTESENLILQVQDITAKKVAEGKLQHEATHDALTGLPNRAYFMSRLSEALMKRRERAGYMVSVLFIDLDRFKFVNDSLGHLVGDQLLIAISRRIRDAMRPPDIVARLGGDEFIILIEGMHDEDRVSEIAERIQTTFESVFEIRGHEVFSSASIGILHASEKHLTAEDMIRDADTAMYQAKRSGKARHEVFHETMRTEVRETLQLETDLRRAIQNREISVCYQPIFALQDEIIVGVEALARWDHPELGDIAPSKFIRLAEEIGWIDSLGEQVMTYACTEILTVFDALQTNALPKLSINVSSKQFARADLVKRLKKIIDETGFEPSMLKLEITESVFVDYEVRAIEMLGQLRSLGVNADIDDFGTGYSNLSHLVRLPISTLKIDRSFVGSMGQDGSDTEIVRMILSMAQNLGLTVVAEGIETPAQLESLKRLGCQRGQGYLLARPMNGDQLLKFLADRLPPGMPPPHTDDLSVISTVQ